MVSPLGSLYDPLYGFVGLKYLSQTEEKGVVSVSSTGAVIGIGTEFTKFFRNAISLMKKNF